MPDLGRANRDSRHHRDRLWNSRVTRTAPSTAASSPVSSSREVWCSPGLYLRWGAFVLHETTLNIAVRMCNREHLPFVILLNYLWPTAILIFSILFAGLKITRRWAFILGTIIVLGSLSAETLAGKSTSALFDHANDRIAYGLALLAALSWGLYSALTRRYGYAAGGRDVVGFFQLTLALALPVSFLPGLQVPWGFWNLWKRFATRLLLLHVSCLSVLGLWHAITGM